MELLTEVAGEAIPLALIGLAGWALVRRSERRARNQRLADALDADTPTRRAWYCLAADTRPVR